MTANGTNLKFSWFLDDNELYDNTNGIEINNKNNGMQSTLQLSNNIVTSIKNLRAFASNIDSTDSSDLRGMGSEVVRNRSDSVELWLYPVTGKFQIFIITPSLHPFYSFPKYFYCQFSPKYFCYIRQ